MAHSWLPSGAWQSGLQPPAFTQTHAGAEEDDKLLLEGKEEDDRLLLNDEDEEEEPWQTLSGPHVSALSHTAKFGTSGQS